MYDDTRIFSEIGDKVSVLLDVDIENVNDIDLIEDPFYMVTVDNVVYTYNLQTGELKEGIQASANQKSMLTAAEKEKYAAEDMNLIHFVLKGVNKNNIPYEELYSVGSLGFAKALNGYRKNKGTKFSTFAVYCIRNEVFFYLKKEQKHMLNLSLNQSLSDDGNGHDLVLGDLISEEDIGKKSLEEVFEDAEMKKLLLKIINKLSPIEQEVMLSRFDLTGQKKTQAELAQKFDMTQANVSKIQQNCLKKMLIYLKVHDQRVNN